MEETTSPAFKLRSYLEENGIAQHDFAKAVGSKQSIISRLAAGKIGPGLDLAFRIERATKGDVPASAWVPVPEPEPQPEQEKGAA